MSIATRQMFLEGLEARLESILTVKQSKETMKAVSEVLASYELEYIGDQSDLTKDYVKAFLDAKAIEGRSEKTIERYRYLLGRLFECIHVPATQVTTYHLRGYLMDEKNRGISEGTLEGLRSVMCSFFGWLWKEGLLEKNPCANIAPIKQKKILRKPYTPEDIEKLKEVADTRDKAIISMLLSTGCRISEVCGLNRDDIDFQKLECKVLGKGNKERKVYIDGVTAMLLKRYLKTRKDIAQALFVGKGTQRMTPHGVRKMLNTVAERAGVEHVHPHRFRRTLATNLINRGMPIQEVAAVLGHDKIDTTMKYIFIEDENVKSAYRKYA